MIRQSQKSIRTLSPLRLKSRFLQQGVYETYRGKLILMTDYLIIKITFEKIDKFYRFRS